MDFFTKYRRQMSRHIVLPLVLHGLATLGAGWYVYRTLFTEAPLISALIVVAVYIVGAVFVWAFILRDSIEPVRNLWDVIQYVAPNSDQHVSPDIDSTRIGRDMIATLANHVYQLASVVDDVERTAKVHVNDIHASFVANALPLPLKQRKIQPQVNNRA